MKLLFAAIATVLLGLSAATAVADTAAAANYRNNKRHTSSIATCEGDITIPVKTIVRGPKDSEHKLGTVEAQDGEYKLTVIAINQGSVHPNNDIIVRSGESELTVKDVERRAFGQETASGTLQVTDGKVSAYVKLGKDKVFSGGVCLVLTYLPPQQPEEPKEPKQSKEEDHVAEPQVLPAAGPGAVVAAVATLSTVGGYLGHLLITRGRQ